MYLDREPEAVTVQALYSPEHDNVDMMASGLLEFPGGVNVTREERLKGFNSFELQADVFAKAVLDGVPLAYEPEDAVSNMKVIDACIESARSRKRVEIG
ncbi:Gfo/Idh/MocA family oxidoreductase [Paenibacillus sp. NPDC055715]